MDKYGTGQVQIPPQGRCSGGFGVLHRCRARHWPAGGPTRVSRHGHGLQVLVVRRGCSGVGFCMLFFSWCARFCGFLRSPSGRWRGQGRGLAPSLSSRSSSWAGQLGQGSPFWRRRTWQLASVPILSARSLHLFFPFSIIIVVVNLI